MDHKKEKLPTISKNGVLKTAFKIELNSKNLNAELFIKEGSKEKEVLAFIRKFNGIFGPIDEKQNREEGGISFNAGKDGDSEIIFLSKNGDIYLYGKLIENDKELVQGLRDFLANKT